MGGSRGDGSEVELTYRGSVPVTDIAFLHCMILKDWIRGVGARLLVHPLHAPVTRWSCDYYAKAPEVQQVVGTQEHRGCIHPLVAWSCYTHPWSFQGLLSRKPLHPWEESLMKINMKPQTKLPVKLSHRKLPF